MMDVEFSHPRKLGSLILFRRNAAGLTQEELADRTGLSVRTIRDIERGRTVTPSQSSIRLLASALERAAGADNDIFAVAAANRVSALRVDPDPGQSRAPDTSEAINPSQTPAGVGDFTGRSVEVDTASRMLAAGISRHSGRAAIAAIVGMPGIGKTTLAVRVAHQVAESFPDGQLYANLQGSDHPVPAQEAVPRFLHNLCSGMSSIREGTYGAYEEYLGRYQSLLAGKRILIVLDDAYDAAQVHPLIPSAPHCGILITSRNRLPDLEGAYPLTLGTLMAQEARDLLARIIGPDRIAAEAEATDAVLKACSGLPLAIRIAGARLASRPHWKIATLAERLASSERLIDELRLGSLSVTACLRRSYDQLLRFGDVGCGAREIFAFIGQLDSAVFTVDDIAAAAGRKAADIENYLEFLVDANLLDLAPPGSYRAHDLIRLFCRTYCSPTAEKDPCAS
jgi:transcriptional regulator with XRE-family HTH domain